MVSIRGLFTPSHWGCIDTALLALPSLTLDPLGTRWDGWDSRFSSCSSYGSAVLFFFVLVLIDKLDCFSQPC